MIPDLPIHNLKEPFPPTSVSWRVGTVMKDKSKGIALAYIDARDVMRRLDEVVGPGNWQAEYPHVGQITVCRIGIKLNGEWVWKANGAGTSDIEAEKGALSDAFKRAAVLWGIGQYLYDLDSPWVTLDTYKDAQGNVKVKGIAKQEYPRLHKLLGGQTSNQLREAAADLPMDADKWKEFLTELYQTTSAVQVHALYRDRLKTWPKLWMDQVVEACAERKKALEKADAHTGEVFETVEEEMIDAPMKPAASYRDASEGK